MPITLGDVAKSAKMSVPAVSQILNGKGSYRPESRERVMAAAASLGYQPNVYAQAMTRRSFGTYALVLSNNPSSSLLPRGMLEGFDAVLSPKGLHLVLAFLPDRELTDGERVPKILSHMLADGLLINYNAGYPKEAVRVLAEKNVPHVWLNVDHEHDAVHPDDYGAGVAMAKLFIARGHRRLAWFDVRVGPNQASVHYSTAARRDGFTSASRTARILGLPRGTPETEHTSYLVRILSAPNRPTAIGCYGDQDAQHVIAAAQRLGLRIPEDLSLAVIGDRAWRWADLAVDTFVIDTSTQTATAVEMLGQLVSGAKRQAAVAIPLLHQVGASVADAP